ncbi:protein lplB [Virgibacillus soli]|uniref:Protein lplB n=2 Tax=Lederbergia galactosidilytica TaxID=217031 RepID=A0A177ZVU7_9BACI|nr:ABC transporter permease subunit [Lederbergia galactosidilytica]KRG14391.1 protein lplB [Virgibacillus soli]OAK70968.1 protein lplB [Lederbergia galactosidilytica]
MKYETVSDIPRQRNISKMERLRLRLWKDRHLLLLLLPGLLYFIVYKYAPMFGIVLAFKDFNPFVGFLESDWVGLKHFRTIFADDEVLRVIWNTLALSFLQILFVFPVPIVIALMLNEVRNQAYKRLIQSIVYLPHFLSWVVVISIVFIFLKSNGLVNSLIHELLGVGPFSFLSDPGFFRPLVILEVIWKESGWSTIILLAAVAGVSPELYEAAIMDGASRWRRIWHVTLPAIRNVIIILLILRIGNVMDSGFEQIFLMLNSFNMEIGNVLDTFVYFKGIQQADFSFSTAVGLFKGVVGLILVVLANTIAKRFGEESLY